MVAGHLREKNGYYQMVFSFSVNDKRYSPYISTGLKTKGNKTKAATLLMAVQQIFDIEAYTNSTKQYRDFLKCDYIPACLMDTPMEQRPMFGEIAAPQATSNALGTVDTIDLKEFAKLLEGGAVVHPSGDMPFCAYLLYWLRAVRSSLDEGTWDAYAKCINRVIIPHFEPFNLRLNEVDKQSIKGFLKAAKQRKGRKGKSVTANTVNHYRAYLHAAMQYAVDEDEVITLNPVSLVKRLPVEQFISDFYNEEDINTLLGAADGVIYEVLIVLAAYYGLRRSEVLGLKWSAIDFVRKTITIRHTVTRPVVDGQYTMVCKDKTKTKKSYRVLPLIPQLENLLVSLKAEQQQRATLYENGYCKQYADYICVNEIGELLKPDFVSNNARRIMKLAGLPQIRFHDLRHSCASLLLAAGISLKEIQEWLGHSTIVTTANVYAHLDMHNKEKLANVITVFCPGAPEQAKQGA